MHTYANVCKLHFSMTLLWSYGYHIVGLKSHYIIKKYHHILYPQGCPENHGFPCEKIAISPAFQPSVRQKSLWKTLRRQLAILPRRKPPDRGPLGQVWTGESWHTKRLHGHNMSCFRDKPWQSHLRLELGINQSSFLRTYFLYHLLA